MTAPGETNIVSAPPNLALWVGVLGIPALWGLQMTVTYAMPPMLCRMGTKWPAHLVTIACIGLAVVGAVLSYRDWQSTGGGSPDQTDGGPLARRRFLGALGLVSGVLYILVMIAQGMSAFYFDPCWTGF
jgi:hypothetical protein